MHALREKLAAKRVEESAARDAKTIKWKKSSFSWSQLYHALLGPVQNLPDGSFTAEMPLGLLPMRLYTDHRVMGKVVLPGVSHFSLMASTAAVAHGGRYAGGNDWYIKVTDVLFERPFFVTASPDDEGKKAGTAAKEDKSPAEASRPLPSFVACRAAGTLRAAGDIPAQAMAR